MKRFKLGLMTRIALALAAIGLIPLGLVTARLIGINHDTLKDQVLETHSMAARAAADRVGAFLASLDSLASIIGSHPSILNDPQSNTARELLAGTLQARPDISAIFLVDEADETIIGAQRRDLAEELAPVLAQPDAERPRTLAGQGRRWLRLDSPLQGGGGTLRLIADASALARMVSSIELGTQAALVLATQEGEVLAGSVRSLDSFPMVLIERASALKVDGSGEFDPVIEEADNVLGAFAVVHGADWYVASRQAASIARANLTRMQRQSWIAFGLALALVSLLSALSYFTLVRPIRSLIGAQRRLAGLSPIPTGGHEIDQLRSSFAVIERRIRDQEAIGKVFLGRYQVIEVLGEGAMGTVFRGWDPTIKRHVALKTVRLAPDMMDSRRRELASQLLREAAAAARINHNNIVLIYDVEDSPEVAFIAMEFIEGIGLDQLLWQRGPLASDQTCALGVGVARALAASHSQGVVHRDVKPSNVLLGFDGEIKVADFGIAEFLSAMTNENETFFGTPGYVPPETLRGEGYDELGDLFSLGVLLYECATGLQPFAGKNLRETALKTLKKDPPRPITLQPTTPPKLDRLIMSLLAKDRSQRPRSGQQAIDLLEDVTPGQSPRWSAKDLPRRPERIDPQTVARSRLMNTSALTRSTRKS